MIITVSGKVFTGFGDGRRFSELPWVRKRVKDELGFDPYPGTLNLSLPSDAQIANLLSRFKGWEIPAQEGYYSGRFFRASVMGKIPGAVVRPETPDYPRNVLEIMAAVYLRGQFHLEDGHEVEIKIWLE